jgi:hypothetical protein
VNTSDTASCATCTGQRDVSSAADYDPWMYHMRQGNFSAAWRVCDEVLRARRGTSCSHRPRHEQWIWDGRPLADQRVLIRCYHGLGDTVQFIRYAALIKAIAREVIVWAQPELLPILQSARGIDRLLPLHDGAPEMEYDVDVESMELGHVCRSTLKTLPATVPYLHARPAKLANPASFDGRLQIGLIWSVGNWDSHRTVPLDALAPLMGMPDVCLHVLQRGPARNAWPRGVGVLSGSDAIEETAAIMQALDLVISVDSFPAHLAGALAVPTWTLVPHEANWRWMVDRSDTPWYPTMRLFRQQRPDDWTHLVARVRDELQVTAARRTQEPLDQRAS